MSIFVIDQALLLAKALSTSLIVATEFFNLFMLYVDMSIEVCVVGKLLLTDVTCSVVAVSR